MNPSTPITIPTETSSPKDIAPRLDPSVRFALDTLCSRESKTIDEEDSHDITPSEKEESQSIRIKNRNSNATLQTLSPNEQQQPKGTERYLNQKPQSSYYRPISLLVKRSTFPSDDNDEDQATFEDCFFDLLFSASLSVYGTAASLTSFREVGQFMSFFTLLWWSWWCQTLYDVRYRSRHHSSLFAVCAHRAIRILLLGTWVAFSTCASEFSRGTYTNFASVYALTRLALLLDHLVSTVDPPPTRYTSDASKEKLSSRFLCHFVNMSATTFSLLCWSASRFLTSKGIAGSLTTVVFTLWSLSVAAEISGQVYVELYGPFACLSTTQLVERLALFSLIIFGGGYENIGLALNAISPRETSDKVFSGGWRFATVLNAISAVAIIMLLFFGYFKKAVKRLQVSPIVVLIWSYLHIVLHIASAVIVVGLSKVISFSNTSEALRDFDLHPLRYLPQTADWQNYVKAHFPTLIDFDTIPTITNITDPLELQVSAIQLSILASQGATIPTVEQAHYLIKSTQVFHGMNWPAALQTQFQSYYGLVQSVEDPHTTMNNVRNNLVQFYWIFMCAAFYMLTDVALKAIQGIGEVPSAKKMHRWSLIVRITFAIFLFFTQVAYIQLHNELPNSGLVTFVLPVLAGILLVEGLLQSSIVHSRRWLNHIVSAANEKRQGLKKIRNVARR